MCYDWWPGGNLSMMMNECVSVYCCTLLLRPDFIRVTIAHGELSIIYLLTWWFHHTVFTLYLCNMVQLEGIIARMITRFGCTHSPVLESRIVHCHSTHSLEHIHNSAVWVYAVINITSLCVCVYLSLLSSASESITRTHTQSSGCTLLLTHCKTLSSLPIWSVSLHCVCVHADSHSLIWCRCALSLLPESCFDYSWNMCIHSLILVA